MAKMFDPGEDDDKSDNAYQEIVSVGETHKGKAIFATRTYEDNWVVGEMDGRLIDDPDYTSEYCIDLEDGRVLEPDPPFRFANHSCSPNCHFDWFEVCDMDTGQMETCVYLIASTRIRPGEELTIDYNWPAEAAIPCQCNSDECRGWIVDPDELPMLMEQIARQTSDS